MRKNARQERVQNAKPVTRLTLPATGTPRMGMASCSHFPLNQSGERLVFHSLKKAPNFLLINDDQSSAFLGFHPYAGNGLAKGMVASPCVLTLFRGPT